MCFRGEEGGDFTHDGECFPGGLAGLTKFFLARLLRTAKTKV